MIVGVCKLSFFLPECRSLKDKRSILRRMKDKFFARFKISLAEVDGLDLWQRAGMGFAIVGNDKRLIESIMDKAIAFLESNGSAQVIDRSTEIMHL
jgi:uncharacterized protein YlxP (DUF503 family)